MCKKILQTTKKLVFHTPNSCLVIYVHCTVTTLQNEKFCVGSGTVFYKTGMNPTFPLFRQLIVIQ